MRRCPTCGHKPSCWCENTRKARTDREREAFKDNIRQTESLAFIYFDQDTNTVEVLTSSGQKVTMRAGDSLTLTRSAQVAL